MTQVGEPSEEPREGVGERNGSKSLQKPDDDGDDDGEAYLDDDIDVTIIPVIKNHLGQDSIGHSISRCSHWSFLLLLIIIFNAAAERPVKMTMMIMTAIRPR